MPKSSETVTQVNLVELVRNLRNLSNEQLAKVAEEAKTQAGQAAAALQVSIAAEKSVGFEQGQAQAGRYLNDFGLKDKFTQSYNFIKKDYLIDTHLPPPASDFSVAAGIAELRQQSAIRTAELLTQAREQGVTQGMISGPKKDTLREFGTELGGKWRGLLAQMEIPSKTRHDLIGRSLDGGSLTLPDFLKQKI